MYLWWFSTLFKFENWHYSLTLKLNYTSFKLLFFFLCRSVSVWVQQNGDTPSYTQVRIWQLLLTRPSRWGPLNRPRQDRSPRQSPCLQGHLSLKPYRWASPAPEPACSPARSLGECGCTSELFHTPGGRRESLQFNVFSLWKSFQKMLLSLDSHPSNASQQLSKIMGRESHDCNCSGHWTLVTLLHNKALKGFFFFVS